MENIAFAIATHIGKREGNEDAALALRLGQSRVLLAVADGMGGHKAGEVASGITIETLKACADEPFAESFALCNYTVFEHALAFPECEGMGTTLVAALIDPVRCRIGYVGDSRIYHFDGQQLLQKTRDHSYVAELVRNGLLTEAEARLHPYRSRITRAIGTDPVVETDTAEFRWKTGDLLLLCSDGLTDVLTDDQLCELISRPLEPEALCQTLIRHALENNAADNITVILARNGGYEQ